MTGAEIMAVVGFIVMLMGFLFGIWKYIDGKLTTVRAECATKIDAVAALATMARSEISDQRLHASETFATKTGMQEQTNSLLRAIEGIASRIDGLGERIDRMWESHAKPTSRTRS